MTFHICMNFHFRCSVVVCHRQRRHSLCSALIQLHQHASKDNVVDILTRLRIPDGIFVVISKYWPGAVVVPPTSAVTALARWLVVVVLIGSAELHPVGDSVRMKRGAKSIICISAESRHTQTVLVSLRTHREWWILHRVPESGVPSDLKTQTTQKRKTRRYA